MSKLSLELVELVLPGSCWPFVHGLQDAQMKASLIASGLSSRQEERDKMPGVPIEDLDRQRADDQTREVELQRPAANPRAASQGTGDAGTGQGGQDRRAQ